MAHTITISLALGSSQTGLTLKAALVDTAGSIGTHDITTGFVEIGVGNYQWTYASMTDGFRGSVVFYTGTLGSGTDFTGVVVKAVAAINPEETEASSGSGSSASQYYADVYFTRDQRSLTDEYTVVWFKDGVPQATGVTSPTLRVSRRTDGTDLIAQDAMTAAGSTCVFRYDVTQVSGKRPTKGEAYVAEVKATIDGSTRTWQKVVGRDV